MAKFKKADYKKQQNFYSIVGKIGDILFYPIIIITLICCFAIFTSKADNKVPTILGFSMVHVNTGSMEAAGFKIGDIVFLHKTSVNKLRCGDIIAFYEVGTGKKSSDQDLVAIQTYKIYKDSDTSSHGEITQEFDSKKFKELRSQERTYEDKTSEKITKTTRILYHRIIGIYIGQDGTIFYKTQGDSNTYNDNEGVGSVGSLISENAVISKYIYTPDFVRKVFNFVATSTGMICIIVAPLCLLILFMLFSIIEQLSKMSLEKKVIGRLISYKDPEVLKANIGIEMEIFDKAKFYATTEEKERNEVAYFLWGYMNNTKQGDEYRAIMNALKDVDKDNKKYWMFFMGRCKSKFQKRMLTKSWQEYMAEVKMKEKFIYVQKQKQNNLKKLNNENQNQNKKIPQKPQNLGKKSEKTTKK